MSYIDDIINSEAYLSRSGYRYHVTLQGLIVFPTDMSSKTVTAQVQVADPTLTIHTIPERFQLAAQYWVLHRYWTAHDVNKANYYYGQYELEWAKTRHNRLGSGVCAIGYDL